MKQFLFLTCLLAGLIANAQTPALRLSATTENVAGAPDSVRIDLFRWSTDAERDALIDAWNLKTSPSGRGAGVRTAAPDPTFGDAGAGGPAAAAGRGAVGGGGRGGRGGAASAPARLTPEASLAAALERAETVGYLWTSEVAGYALRYAARIPAGNSGDRIVLITERRLGAWNDSWKPASGAPGTSYDFSIIELRLNKKDEGEGKASLAGKISVDAGSKTIGLENYGVLPVVLKNVKRREN